MNELNAYRRDFKSACHCVRTGRAVIRTPGRRELHRKRPRSHFHATPELFIQTGGATDFDCAGETFRLHAGELCVMPRGVPHAEVPVDEGTPYGVAVCMYGRDGLSLVRGSSETPGKITSTACIHFKGGRGHDIFRYLDDVSDLEDWPEHERQSYACALLQAFLLAACVELERPQLERPPSGSPLVSNTEKFALTNLSNPRLSVAEIARELGCTADHLSRLFHRDRGMPLTTWLARERTAQARRLLASPRYNISEVGWACGFNEPSYFIRIFRRHVGMTPRQYRISLRGA